MEAKKNLFEEFTKEKIAPLLNEFFSDEIKIIVSDLNKLERNKYITIVDKEIEKIEKEKRMMIKELEKRNSMKKKDRTNNEKKHINEDSNKKDGGGKGEFEILNEDRDKNLAKRISHIILKSAIINLMIDAFPILSKEKLDSNYFYQDNKTLYKDISNIIIFENDDNTDTDNFTYSLNKEKRISFFLNDSSYSDWSNLFETIRYENNENFNPPVAKALLPYYLYSIYKSSKDDTLDLKIKTLFKQSVDYKGRNKKIYSMKKYKNFMSEFPKSTSFGLKFIDIEKIMAKNELKKNMQIEDFIMSKNKKIKGN